MSGVPACLASILAVSGLALPARGQAVISTHSGLVHFFEEEVSISGQRLVPRVGRFVSIPEGAELRTGKGRAEVLLTPGVFVRIGENSAIRMIATALSATRVELLAGSAIVSTDEPAPGTSVTFIFRNWSIRQDQKGGFRVDCEPARVSVLQGRAKVWKSSDAAPVAVQEGQELAFTDVLTPRNAGASPQDALAEWAGGRAQSISADNTIAANIQDPADLPGLDLPDAGFTYFPMIGLPTLPAPSLANTYGAYGSWSASPGAFGGSPGLEGFGFYSLYLPGYTYSPLLLNVPLYRSPLSDPLRIGVPRFPGLHLPTYHPIAPVIRPPGTYLGGMGGGRIGGAHMGGMHIGGGHR